MKARPHGSQSIEVSGRSVRLVSAELRARVLDRLAQRLNCSPAELTVEDGVFHRGDAPTGHDYWNFASAEDFARDIEGNATPKPHTAYRYVGKPMPRRDLPAKVTGLRRSSTTWCGRTCCMRASCASHVAARGWRRWTRRRCGGRNAASSAWCGWAISLRSSGDDEAVVQRAAAAAPMHAKWDNVRQITPDQQEAAWLVGQPSERPRAGRSAAGGRDRRMWSRRAIPGPMSRMPRWRRPARWPSIATGICRCGRTRRGPYPLRAALANVLGIAQDTITVRHAHGAGCYGHNGADDVAVDAAVIALQVPDHCIRVQWRREEEFGFEPRRHRRCRSRCAPRWTTRESRVDWTAEIWSATHVQRPEQRRQHADP